MSEQKIEGVPDGWRFVGFRKVKAGEWYIDKNGRTQQWDALVYDTSIHVYGVIEKIATYRDVTPDDVGKIVEILQGGKWYERKLLAVLPETFEYRYIYQTSNNKSWSYLSRTPRIKE